MPSLVQIMACSAPHQTILSWSQCDNSLRLRQNGRHFADDTFNSIFVNENVEISIEFSLKFVPKGPINYIPALVQIMAWRRPGDKPLSEPVMISLLRHICVTRPQLVKPVFHHLQRPLTAPLHSPNGSQMLTVRAVHESHPRVTPESPSRMAYLAPKHQSTWQSIRPIMKPKPKF